MADPAIRHETVELNGIAMHVARAGRGRPLLLLHGWPEFWLTYAPLMQRLAGGFELLAPDLRGFGLTGRPAGPPDRNVGAAAHAADLRALLDALGLARVGLVGHDVGAYVAQVMARQTPERLAGLVFFDCPYPGIASRWIEPRHIKEIWYQTFHQQPWAASVVGASRESVRTYVSHFLRHWSGRKDAFEPVLEQWVDNFQRPGNLQGGFDWYGSAAEDRLAVIEGRAPRLAPIDLPTRILWGEVDPIIPARWTDRLPEFFTDLELTILQGIGHFPHMEAPELVAPEIARFFEQKARW